MKAGTKKLLKINENGNENASQVLEKSRFSINIIRNNPVTSASQ